MNMHSKNKKSYLAKTNINDNISIKSPKVLVSGIRVTDLNNNEEKNIFYSEVDSKIMSNMNDKIIQNNNIVDTTTTTTNNNSNYIVGTNNNNDKEKVFRERELFLHAALQLLEQKENDNQRSLKRNSYNNINNPLLQADIIRCGSLKKAISPSRMFTNSNSLLWKSKYIELRHGMFSYEDEGLDGYTWKIKKKYIQLSVTNCRCRAYKVRSPEGDCIFELTLIGGPRRLWLASSSEERDLWINTIKTAMIGSCGDFSVNNIDNINNISNLPQNFSNFSIGYSSPKSKTNSSNIDGETAAYASDISKFSSIRTAIANANTIGDYRKIINKLKSNGTKLTIPVIYIKVIVVIIFKIIKLLYLYLICYIFLLLVFVRY